MLLRAPLLPAVLAAVVVRKEVAAGGELAPLFVDTCLQAQADGRDCHLWDSPTTGGRALLTGDLLFFRDQEPKSKAQRLFTGAPVTHVGVVAWVQRDPAGLAFVPAHEAGAALALVEVSNHANKDLATGVARDGFQVGDLYAKLQHQPKTTSIFIRRRAEPLDAARLRSLETVSACLHARRPRYLKFLTAKTEDTLSKFYDAWRKQAKEADEKYEMMFCSQFAALLVMEWEGPLAKKDGTVMLPGDFDPGDLFERPLSRYDPPYELQLPYAHYKSYKAEARAQAQLLAPTRVRPSNAFKPACLSGLDELPYASRHLPTWTGLIRAEAERGTVPVPHGPPTYLRQVTLSSDCGYGQALALRCKTWAGTYAFAGERGGLPYYVNPGPADLIGRSALTFHEGRWVFATVDEQGEPQGEPYWVQRIGLGAGDYGDVTEASLRHLRFDDASGGEWDLHLRGDPFDALADEPRSLGCQAVVLDVGGVEGTFRRSITAGLDGRLEPSFNGKPYFHKHKLFGADQWIAFDGQRWRVLAGGFKPGAGVTTKFVQAQGFEEWAESVDFGDMTPERAAHLLWLSESGDPAFGTVTCVAAPPL